jgi:hypothetical protein
MDFLHNFVGAFDPVYQQQISAAAAASAAMYLKNKSYEYEMNSGHGASSNFNQLSNQGKF